MARQKIEIASNSILPIQRGLWSSAREKLDEASISISQMESAKNRADFEKAWFQYVDCLEEFWVRFYAEGTNIFSIFQPWAGSINKTRNDDGLLRYLIEERHQSQHGHPKLDWEEEKLRIAPNFNGHLRGLRFYPNQEYEIDAVPLAPSAAPAKVVYEPGKPLLPKVFNKKTKITFLPPTQHLNKPIIDSSPMGIARLGYQYYENLLQDAFIKFKPVVSPD